MKKAIPVKLIYVLTWRRFCVKDESVDINQRKIYAVIAWNIRGSFQMFCKYTGFYIVLILKRKRKKRFLKNVEAIARKQR